MPDTLQQLRNAILLEADWHNAHARRLDLWAQYCDTMGFGAFARELATAGKASRERVKLLNAILVASQPKAEAS